MKNSIAWVLIMLTPAFIIAAVASVAPQNTTLGTKICRDGETLVPNGSSVLECAPAFPKNRCPVCREPADPYKPKPDSSCVETTVFDTTTGKRYDGCDPALLPKSRITRCKRCNAAFWQDAEEDKKP